jgi:anti-sigma B factor antagonist
MRHRPLRPHLSRPEGSPAARTATVPGCDADRNRSVSLLDIRVAAGEAGPMVTLSGEADLTTVAQLEAALNAQIAAGARVLTVDLSRMWFADCAAIHTLVRAAGTLRARGGRMDLLNPQPGLDRVLTLLGVDEVLRIYRGDNGPGPRHP